jgi:cell division septation protein DedD
MTSQAKEADPNKAAAKAAPAKPDAAAAKPRPKAAPAAKPETAELWVQVGAYRDPATAKKVATGLKEKGYEVAESIMTTGGATASAATEGASGTADKYDVLVTGAASAEIVKKLSAKGLSVETVRDGTVVRPSLPLRDAVTLSNDLRSEGFTVTVRRVATGATGAAPAATATTSTGGETLHRVRVGAFPDRAAAMAAVEKLRGLGYTPFIARGRE